MTDTRPLTTPTAAAPDWRTTRAEQIRALRHEFPQWKIRYDPADARWYGLRGARSVTAKTATELLTKLRRP